MTNLQPTRHARRRMAQRAITETGLNLITRFGVEVSDGYLLRDKECKAAILKRRKEIKWLERMKGKRIVVVGGSIITAYQANRKKINSLLNRAEQRSLT